MGWNLRRCFHHDFPETVCIYHGDSDTASDLFSLIPKNPPDHPGHHYITRRVISLLFYLRNHSDGNLSAFIFAFRAAWTNTEPVKESVRSIIKNGRIIPACFFDPPYVQ